MMERKQIKEATGAGSSGRFKVPVVLAPQPWDEDQLSPFVEPVYKYTNAQLAYQEADGDYLESPDERKKIENKTKKLSSDWYKSPSEFRTLIKMINKEIKYKPKTKKEEEDYEDSNNESKKSVDILDTGTKVRVTLDYPIDTKGKRLYGKFRAGDIRWSNDIKTIKWIVLKPGEVPMYRVSGEKILRTIQQLQVLK